MFNRKALWGPFTFMQWTLVCILVLVVFAVIFILIHNDLDEKIYDTDGRVDFEAQLYAMSLAQSHITVGGETMLFQEYLLLAPTEYPSEVGEHLEWFASNATITDNVGSVLSFDRMVVYVINEAGTQCPGQDFSSWLTRTSKDLCFDSVVSLDEKTVRYDIPYTGAVPGPGFGEFAWGVIEVPAPSRTQIVVGVRKVKS